MESLALTWWMWLLGGIVLLMLEMVSPGGFYMFFFGAGAVAVGLVSALGFGGPLWFQLLLFALMSIGALLLFRGKLLAWFETETPVVDTLVGEVIVLLGDVATKQTGKGEMRGTTWTVRNAGDDGLRQGQRCAVEKVDGLVLSVRAEGEP
jgi:membrane protein implicated in regulation of membrane protease activity